jgi:hypothetical protein
VCRAPSLKYLPYQRFSVYLRINEGGSASNSAGVGGGGVG